MTKGIYPDELPEFPKVESRLKAFHATSEIASALSNAQKIQVCLDKNNLKLGRNLFDKFNRHLIQLHPELDADTFVLALQTVANLNGGSDKHTRVGAGVLCHYALEHRSVAWFDILAHYYPEVMLFKVFTSSTFFQGWVNNPHTTCDTLTKFAEFIVNTTYTGGHPAELLLALNPICSINPSIIGRLSTL